jgi:hypothetical protein
MLFFSSYFIGSWRWQGWSIIKMYEYVRIC